ncbi:MAG TPA: DUF2059 domain-containing protein [Flavobacterium sp.]|jgi:hypothetical protein|nr:DUF2059 domain-containing protein [Flavobacterium sp.]
MKKLILTLVLVLASQFVSAQDEAYKKDVLRVIEASGAVAPMKMAKTQIMQMIPAEKQAAFAVEFEATMPPVYEKLVKIYSETYTKEDIKAMLVFYDSPVGKKISSKSDALTTASGAAMQEWGQGLQAMMMKYMQ